MSDLFVTQIAYAKAEKSMEALIREYNDPELTPKGKKEALLNCIALSFIGGFRIAKDELQSLRQQLTATQEQLKDAESRLAFYSDIESWCRAKPGLFFTLDQEDRDLSSFPGGAKIAGRRAREYFSKYPREPKRAE